MKRLSIPSATTPQRANLPISTCVPLSRCHNTLPIPNHTTTTSKPKRTPQRASNAKDIPSRNGSKQPSQVSPPGPPHYFAIPARVPAPIHPPMPIHTDHQTAVHASRFVSPTNTPTLSINPQQPRSTGPRKFLPFREASARGTRAFKRKRKKSR